MSVVALPNVHFNSKTGRFETKLREEELSAAFAKALDLITGKDLPDGRYVPPMTNRNAIFHASGGLTEAELEELENRIASFFTP